MLLKPRNLITSSTDVIIYGAGYYLSTLSECCSVKSSETCGVRCYSATKAHKKSYAIVCEHYCVAIKFFLLLRLKEKKTNNPIWTIFLHFYFKWEIYESVIFSLHYLRLKILSENLPWLADVLHITWKSMRCALFEPFVALFLWK